MYLHALASAVLLGLPYLFGSFEFCLDKVLTERLLVFCCGTFNPWVISLLTSVMYLESRILLLRTFYCGISIFCVWHFIVAREGEGK